MQAHSFWYLENIDLTHLLCPAKLGDEALIASHTHCSFKKGEAVCVPQDLSDRIFFITDGRVKISAMNREGKEITKVILGRGEVFGELAFVGEQFRHDFATALEDIDTCVVTLEALRSLMRDRSALNLFFMKVFGSRQLEMERRLESLFFCDNRNRIIEYLVNITRSKGQRVGYEWIVRKPVTHHELANLTATSRQTVATTLHDLRYKKLLTINRSRLLVRDLEKLTEEVKFFKLNVASPDHGTNL